MHLPPDAGQHAYLAVADVADYLGVDPAAVLELVRSGDLRALRIGGQVRIARADLSAFEQEQIELEQLRQRFHEAQEADVIDLFDAKHRRVR